MSTPMRDYLEQRERDLEKRPDPKPRSHVPDVGIGVACDCEFTPDPDDPDENTPETAWHYRRICPACNGVWWSLHCPHDMVQKPCPHCGARSWIKADL